MNLIVEATKEELPLVTANTLRELYVLCDVEQPVVCRIIRQHRTTRKYKNIPAHIYKTNDESD